LQKRSELGERSWQILQKESAGNASCRAYAPKQSKMNQLDFWT